MSTLVKQSSLRGTPISSGIAIGKLFCLHVVEDNISEYSIGSDGIVAEVVRYRNAIDSVKVEIASLQNKLKESDAESLAVLDAHLQILDDPLIDIEIIADIRQKKKNAEYLFNDTVQKWQKKFHDLGDSFFRERVKDLQDVARRVLRALKGKERRSFAAIPENAIIFSKELSPSEVAEASLLSVEGFLTQNAGMASHTAIMSQAKKIPLVSSIRACDVESFVGETVIVDGHTGDVYIDPEPEILAKYLRYSFGLESILKAVDPINLPSETYDGYRVRLSANMEMLHDLRDFHDHGASGVGLFRSEYLFMSQDKFPSEDEQFHIYKEIVESMKGLPVVMRAFDIGGDKYLSGQQIPQENNPFLGCRAIRFLLREKHIFKSQLKAILRASAFGDVSILFPMISSLAELIEAKKIVKEAQDEINCTKTIRIGCMIEVPSAAIIADLLAKECDFLSIGTNDLVQYSLAVDRGNCLLSNLYTPAHPSVIRLIKFVVNEANHQGIPVTVCGEIAADPRFTPLLLGLGVHELSVALHRISDVRAAIRSTSIVRATALAEKVLQLSSPEAIDELLFQEQEARVCL